VDHPPQLLAGTRCEQRRSHAHSLPRLPPPAGTAWLFPLVDGHPPIGWDEASRYLFLPILLVVVQYISTAIVSPPINNEDKNATTQKALYIFLPLMVRAAAAAAAAPAAAAAAAAAPAAAAAARPGPAAAALPRS
jgi:hypothetical protein